MSCNQNCGQGRWCDCAGANRVNTSYTGPERRIKLETKLLRRVLFALCCFWVASIWFVSVMGVFK
jgi:hypothetical protein